MDNNQQIEYKLKNAEKFAASGKFLHAAQIYKSLIEEYPDELEPYFRLTQLYQDQNLIKDAENVLLNFLKNHPDEIDVIIYLAQLYLQNSKWNEIVALLQPVTPDEDPAALFLLGYAYFKLGDFEISKVNFENFLKYNTEAELFYETQLFLSKIHVELNELKRALEYAEKSEKFYANYWELKFIYAKIYFEMKMMNHAIDNIEACIKMTTANFGVYELAGEIYFHAKDYVKSEEYFKKCFNLNDKPDVDLYIKLANVCLKNNKINDAVNFYDLVLNKYPKHNEALKGKKNTLSLIKN